MQSASTQQSEAATDIGADRAEDIVDLQDLLNPRGPRLCRRCRLFDIHAFARQADRTRGYLLDHVVASSQAGCEFCTLLLDAADALEKPGYFYLNMFGVEKSAEPDIYIHMRLVGLEDDQIGSKKPRAASGGQRPLSAFRLAVEVGSRFSDIRNRSPHEVCLVADAESAAAKSGDVAGRYLGHDPATDEQYEAITKWIDVCRLNHAICNQTVSASHSFDVYQSPLPSRVIEISADGNNLRLVESAGKNGRYITVTHRWNQQTEESKTTLQNYQSRLSGGSFDDLPKLYHHFFTIARRLGVHYVWIDSLCIIQNGDGGADWQVEAPKMAHYYQFSMLTIATTRSDAKDGILHQVQSEASHPWSQGCLARLPYRDRNGTLSGHMYAYKRKTRLSDDYYRHVVDSQLMHRGWILQEWLLSKRIVWYTPCGVILECQADNPMTTDQEKLDAETATPELQAHLTLKRSFSFSNMAILDFWYRSIEVYSSCHLTKPDQDHVLAVAGLAKEVHHIITHSPALNLRVGPHYVAGLWLPDIHHGLLWQEAPKAARSTGTVAAASSWSWAHVLAEVRWPERAPERKKCLEVFGVCLEKRDEHGEPVHASASLTRSATPCAFQPANLFSCLHVRGRISVAHVRGYLGTEKNLEVAAKSTACDPKFASQTWRAVCSPAHPEVIAGWGSLEQLRDAEPVCADYGTAVNVLAVSTRTANWGFVFSRSEPVLDVLFLQEVEECEGKYRRLGVGRISEQEFIEHILSSPEQTVQLV